ncbi:MAG: hypothetical protein U0670_16485 [Anaerolineae bacterium]
MGVLSRRLIVLFALMLVMVGAISAAPDGAQIESTDPRAVVLAYYNAINLRDYRTAYNMRPSTQSYEQYAAGFADTVRGIPYVGGAQSAGGGLMYVPLVLVAYHTDGSVTSYYGCFTMGTTTRSWQISRTRMRAIPGGGYPDATTINNYLAVQCSTLSLPVFTPTFVDLSVSFNGHSTLYTYFDLINGRNYNAAYAMWLAPIASPPPPNGAPAQDYRPNAGTFASGYSTTQYITVYLGRYNQTGASAGHSYLDGLQPVVLIGTSTDGTSITYSGCYVIGRFAGTGALGIVNGRLSVLSRAIADPVTILNALNTDCIGLNIPA